MRKIFFLIYGFSLIMSFCRAEIITSASLEEVSGIFDDLQDGDLLVLDVDDTLMTPVSKVFHQRGNPLHFIDELKAEKDKIPHLPEVLGTWRLSRKVQLVNPAWPEILKTLSHKKGVFVFGLTQMETGPCGPIQNMEEWRANELNTFGLTFTPKIAGEPSFRVKETREGKYAAFHNGILMAGPFSKGEVLEAFFTYTKWHPKRIVFFDDRRHNLEDVEKVAMGLGIPYLGIFFKEVDNMLSTPNPRVIEFQKEVLIKQGQWLEDEEAEKRLSQIEV